MDAGARWKGLAAGLLAAAAIGGTLHGEASHAQSASPPAPATFRYGFDLTVQAPDAPGAAPAAVASARGVIARFPGVLMDSSITGFGLVANPEPSRGVFDMSSINSRVSFIQSAGGTPVITLVSAPKWMKTTIDPANGPFNTPPSPDHYADFADLAAHIAQSLPQVRYFVVWSEMRGFYDQAHQSWDAASYTTLYNDVYTAIKRVRPDALVGGPYAVLSASPTPVRNVPSRLAGPWGYTDQSMLDAVSYWLAHKVGADFVALDGATQLAKTASSSLDPVTAATQYAAVDRWVRAQTPLPIWWMESHIQPSTGFTPAAGAAARIATLAEMAASGASVGMQWQPEQSPDWSDEGLWTSTATPDGGQPTPLADLLPQALAILAQGPVLAPQLPAGVLAAGDQAGTVVVNTSTQTAQLQMGQTRFAVAPQQVVFAPPGSVTAVVVPLHAAFAPTGAQHALRHRGVLKVAVGCDAPCTVTVTGAGRIGRRAVRVGATTRLAARGQAPLTLRLPRWALSALRRRRHTRLVLTLRGQATDAAGRATPIAARLVVRP